MLNGRSVLNLLSISTVAAACCIAAACSGPEPQPQIPADPQSSLALIPGPPALVASSASSPGTNFRAGADFDAALPSGQATAIEHQLALAGNPEYGSITYAMFSFAQADAGWEPAVELDWYALDPENAHLIVPQDEARPYLYLGVSDYSRGAWKWFPLAADVIGLSELDRYISESGNLFVVLVSMAPHPLRVEWLRVGDSQWVVEYLEITDIFSDRITAAMDSSDHPRFCNGNRYVWHDGSNWHVEPVDTDISVIYKLLLDDSDKPHICGIVHGDWGLSMYGYATRPSISWSQQWTTLMMTTPMGQPVYEGPYASIDMAIDSHGTPHFAYFSEMERDLYYSGPVPGGDWTKELIDADGETGEKCAIALDGEDRPYIAYHADHHQEGRLAVYDGSQWQISPLADAAGEGVAALTLADGSPLAAFSSGSLNLYSASTGWLPDEVSEIAGGGCLLRLQPDGAPALLFHRYTSFKPAFTAWSAGQWRQRWVDLPENHNVVIYPDNDGLMIDSTGRPHLVYIIGSFPNKLVCYAHLQ